MKAQSDQSGGRVLLGDNAGGGAVMLPSIRFQFVGCGFQLDSLVYTHVFGHMHIQLRPVPDLPEINHPVS